MGRPRKSRNTQPVSFRAARFVRWAQGWTIQAVSERTGIPYYLICDFERGARVLNDTDLAILAKTYDVDASALLKERPVAELSA